MKFSSFMKNRGGGSGAALGLVSALVLCTCDDKEAPPAAPAEAEPTAAAEQEAPQEPELSAFDETRDALFDHVVFQLAQKVSNPELYPEVNAEVRDTLALLNDYYAALEKEAEMAEE